MTRAESKATYAQIKEYILEKIGLKVSALYIAQINISKALERHIKTIKQQSFLGSIKIRGEKKK